MPDDLDAARVGIQLDAAEQAGLVETDVAAWLRELVRASRSVRLEVESEVRRSSPGLCSLVEGWAAGPLPKAPGLTVRLRADGRTRPPGAPPGVLLEMGWRHEGEAYRLARFVGGTDLSPGARSGDFLNSILDDLQLGIVNAIRRGPAHAR